MTHHQVRIFDGSDTADSYSPVVQLRRDPHRVMRPIFKNGREYQPGDTIELDEQTAERFRQAGDIE